MLYRAWIGKTRIITPNLEELINCESVDIFIDNFWQVYR
jgi:hypothetical protein